MEAVQVSLFYGEPAQKFGLFRHEKFVKVGLRIKRDAWHLESVCPRSIDRMFAFSHDVLP